MSPINVVVVKKTNDIISTNGNPVTLRPGVKYVARLDTLNDVVASGEETGAVPVYDATTDKYIIKKLDINDVTGDIDGGVF